MAAGGGWRTAGRRRSSARAAAYAGSGGEAMPAGTRCAANPNAPPPRGSVAFEPMAGMSNAMNLAHKGLYKELQSIPPGGSWEESFWVRPSGY